MSGYAGPSDRPHRRDSARFRSALPCVAAWLLACLIYALTIQTRPAHLDEFYHLLAGRSWQQHGNFALLDGQYGRAPLFTIIVGWTFGLFGQSSMLIARLPSVIFSAISVAILFQWLRQNGGTGAALVGASLFALAGYTFDIAHFARFYAFHSMLVLIATAALSLTIRTDGQVNPHWAILAAASLVLAFLQQPVTVIAILGLAGWLLFDQRVRLMAYVRDHRIVSALLACAVLVGAMLTLPILTGLADRYGRAERWAAATQDDPLYYLREFFGQMPLITLFLPVALILAIRAHSRLGLLCAFMIGLCLLLQSFAGMKAWRYVYYLFPFICMAYGLATAALLPGNHLAARRSHVRALLLSALLFLLLATSPLYRQGARLMLSAAYSMAKKPSAILAPVPDGEWDRVAPQLRRLAMDHAALVTGDDLRTIAHLGGYTVFISSSRLGELTPSVDFTPDHRTGRPTIETAEALIAVIDCNPSGMVIVPNRQWRNPMAVAPRVADLIERRLTPVRSAPDLHVFEWRGSKVLRTCPYARIGAQPRKTAARVFSGTCSPTRRWLPPLPTQSCPSASLDVAANAGAA